MNRLLLPTLAGLLAWVLSMPIQGNEFDNVERVVAVGDIHGAYTEVHALLVGIGLISADDEWLAGRTHVVSLGDLLERGPDSRRVES